MSEKRGADHTGDGEHQRLMLSVRKEYPVGGRSRGGQVMKRTLFPVFLAGAVVFCVSCLPEDWDAVLFRREPHPQTELLDYIEHVKSQPLDFQIPADDDALAWKRAQYISKKYCNELGGSRKLRISTDDVIEIAPFEHDIPNYQDADFLYRIVRAPRGDMTKYIVSYSSPSPDHPNNKKISQAQVTEARAKIIAYYISVGKLYKKAISYPGIGRLT
jgi:hypothetical protein